MAASGPGGGGNRTRGGAFSPSPSVNYYITQVFVAFSEQPQTPMILRVDENATANDVLHQALHKYTEMLRDSDYSNDNLVAFAPPSSSPADYILRVAKGDGTPDRVAPPLDANGVMREQGLLFPYMLVLTLDPDRDVTQMKLTDEYKAYLLQRKQLPSAAERARNDETSLRKSSLNEQDVPIAPPDDQLTETTMSQLQSERNAKKALEVRQKRKDDLESLRKANIRHKEIDRAEKEKHHLELCEKKERERRKRLEEELKSEEQRQLQLMEENHKLEMSRKLEQFATEQKQRELLEMQKKELEKEDKERRRRQEALERERQLRLAQKQDMERQEQAEYQRVRDQGRGRRMDETLDYIISRLHSDIETDNHQRVQMLELEQMERTAYERELFEREYVSKVERQRRSQKETQVVRQLEQESVAARRQAEMEYAIRLREEEEEMETEKRKASWKEARRQEQEKLRRIKELSTLAAA